MNPSIRWHSETKIKAKVADPSRPDLKGVVVVAAPGAFLRSSRGRTSNAHTVRQPSNSGKEVILMKKEYSKPSLEVLNVNMTMLGPGKAKPDAIQPDPDEPVNYS